MNRLLAPALLLCMAAPLLADPSPDGKVHAFTLHDGKFFIDDQPIRLIAGEMHLSRIPAEFWEDRIKKARAMGLNAVSAYIFWNELEPREGVFNFDGINDVRRFVQLCQANGLWVILRAGPYDCAEWEFGGFPAWLLKHKGLRVRSDDPQFMEFSRQYVEKLHGQVGDLLVGHGGPIIMVQFENEYGRIDKYLKDLHGIYVNAGFDGQLMTCDHSGGVWQTLQGLPNVLRGYNGFPQNGEMRFQQAAAVSGPMGYPLYSPEVYTGWFAPFGPTAKSARVAINRQLADTQRLLDHKDVSWCYYVFDGGTNFGFTGGGNSGRPLQTSYDYDAPVDELGRVTPKYLALRDLFIKNLNLDLPPVPPDPAVIEIPKFQLALDAPLLNRLPADAVDSDNAQTMEDLDQNYGFVDYRKTFNDLKGTLQLTGARDYSIVMVDGKVVGEAFDGYGQRSYSMKISQDGPCTLDILVHNLGRTSSPINQAASRKGLNANPSLDGKPLTGWKIYSLPLDDPDQLPSYDAAKNTGGAPTGPTFYGGSFTLDNLGETYLDMSDWHFGVVWVNGHNLGRYWDVGPTRAVYLPSVWQKKGENDIEVLELGTPPKSAEVKGVTKMVETPATTFKPFWVKSPGN
jgi:beta-galactosidase